MGEPKHCGGGANGCGGFGNVPLMQHTFASERLQVRCEHRGAKIASCPRRHKIS